MNETSSIVTPPTPATTEWPGNAAGEASLSDILFPLFVHWRALLLVPLLVAVAAFGATYLIAPTYTARTTFIVPTPNQASAAITTLNALSSATGGSGSTRNAADQYMSLLQSRWVADRLVDRFGLIEIYRTKYRFEARAGLESRTRIAAGKRDGLISVEYDDTSPERSAAVANRYIEELRSLTDMLALSEAQQRRTFFQRELDRTREQLAKAQQALQSSGFDERTLRAEPRSAADGYARIRAEVTAAEIRLIALRRTLTDGSPEVQQQQAVLGALRAQMSRAERSLGPTGDTAYLSHYREFKYQEGLLEFLTRQQEAARLDESREGAMLQVVDQAVVPEWKSKPKRLFAAAISGAAAFVVLALFFILRARWRIARADPSSAVHRWGTSI